MLTLSLLRHAKSSWSEDDLSDYDRPLNKRGKTAAPAMGNYIAQNNLQPDLILCSPAKRARETMNLMLKAFPTEPEIRFEDTLYHASPRVILEHVQAYGMDYPHILVIGHNPGFHAFALRMTKSASPKDMTALLENYPTAALAVLDLDAPSWNQVKEGEAHLRLFMMPKALPEETKEAEDNH